MARGVVARTGALGALGLLLALGAATPAAGAGAPAPRGLQIDVRGDTRGMGEVPDGPVLLGRLLAPGDEVTGQVVLRTDIPGRLRVVATDVRSDDNGCDEPEREAGDTTCGPGGGELAGALRLTVRRGGELLWEGSLAALAHDGLPASSLTTGEDAILDWTATVSRSTGNEAQGDSVGFDLRFDLQGSEVEGSAVGRVDVTGLPGALARSGWSAGSAVRVGGALLLAGSGLLLVAERRRGRRAPSEVVSPPTSL